MAIKIWHEAGKVNSLWHCSTHLYAWNVPVYIKRTLKNTNKKRIGLISEHVCCWGSCNIVWLTSFWASFLFIRVANVVADHDDLLTQWRPIKMSNFRANIFLIRTTSNYFWASEVFKNLRFKSHLFSFSQYKKYAKLKKWVNFYAIIILY